MSRCKLLLPNLKIAWDDSKVGFWLFVGGRIVCAGLLPGPFESSYGNGFIGEMISATRNQDYTVFLGERNFFVLFWSTFCNFLRRGKEVNWLSEGRVYCALRSCPANPMFFKLRPQ